MRTRMIVTELGWDAVALFLQRNKHLLDSKHHAFIDDMTDMASRSKRKPTLPPSTPTSMSETRSPPAAS